MLSYLLAVLAAGANATSSVLQRKANRRVPQAENLSPRLIWSLLHEWVWFGGILAVIVGFLLQAAALSSGQLAAVEPILVLELPATLILASRVFRSRLGWREWGAAIAMTVGLAVMLYLLSPSSGHPGPVTWYVWAAGIGVNLALIAGLVVWGRRGPTGRGGRHGHGSAFRAAMLGAAAGSGFGLTAALIKGMVSRLSAGIGAVLASWQLYAMIAAGLFAMFLLQSAMNAGRLIAAQPGVTLSDPIVSILWGVLAFGEQVRGGWFVLPEVASGLVIAAAVLVLARSPLLSGGAAQREEGGPPHPGRGGGSRAEQGGGGARPRPARGMSAGGQAQ